VFTFQRVTRARLPVLAAVVFSAAIALSGCGSDSESGSDSAESAAVEVTDAWVRTSDGPMTGIYAVIDNTTDADITIDSAANTASSITELHEMAMIDGEMVMQEKAGGVVLPANSEVVLQPGGDHIMAMGMTGPVQVGDEIEVTLTLSNGQTVSFMAVGKESAAGDEEYHGGDDMEMNGDME